MTINPPTLPAGREQVIENAKLQLLNEALTFSGMIMFLWEPQTDILHYVSPGVNRWGYSPSRIKNMDTLLESVHPEDRKYVLENCANPVSSLQTVWSKFRIILRDGSERTICAQQSPLDNILNPLLVRVIWVDITEEKESESLSLTDLIDISSIRQWVQDISEKHDLPSSIVDVDGNVLAQSVSRCRLCTLLRNTSRGEKLCRVSEDNLRIAASERGDVAYCFCECAGLAEACAPVMAGGKPVAFWFYGKVRTAEVSGGNIVALASRVGIDPDTALEAFNEIKNRSPDDVHHMAELLHAQAALLSNMAQQNYLLRKQTEKAVREAAVSETKGNDESGSGLEEKFLSGETIFSGRVFTVRRDVVRCPDGSQAEREVIRHPGGVAVLALDEQDNVVMVRQYRYALGRVMLEIPAGKLEPGEDPAEAARRELSEETGYEYGALMSLGTFVPTCGYDTEVIYLFLARRLVSGAAHPDEGEFVSTEKIPLAELEEMALSGELTDSKALIALYRLRLWRKLNGEENIDN